MNLPPIGTIPLAPAAAGPGGPNAEPPAGHGTAAGTADRGPRGRAEADDQREIERLKARDREIRAHEQAHLAAAGGLARGGASFSYTRGPDGRRYATGGEVQIDVAAVAGDPAATLRKAQQIQRAALAPADPSAQDRQVAARAAAMAREAQAMVADSGSDAGPTAQPLGPRARALAIAVFEPAVAGTRLDVRA